MEFSLTYLGLECNLFRAITGNKTKVTFSDIVAGFSKFDKSFFLIPCWQTGFTVDICCIGDKAIVIYA